jgi:hypothetical protein
MRGVTISILAERPTPRRHAAAHAHADSAAAAAAAAMAVPRAGACRCLGPAAARAAPSSGFGVRSSSRPWLLERLSRARASGSCQPHRVCSVPAAPLPPPWLAGWLAGWRLRAAGTPAPTGGSSFAWRRRRRWRQRTRLWRRSRLPEFGRIQHRKLLHQLHPRQRRGAARPREGLPPTPMSVSRCADQHRWRPLVTGEHGAPIRWLDQMAVGLTAVAARESGVAVACRHSSREYEAPPPPPCAVARARRTLSQQEQTWHR